VFWWYAFQFARLPAGGPGGWTGIALAVGGWLALLGGAYLLMGALVGRSSELFLERRRRLLNEHGIRWHDCLATDRHCERCWAPDRTHRDLRYDCERFCRCPAC